MSVQGGIGLTLLDSLDSLLLFGMEEEFKKGVSLIEEHIHFNSSTRVHVFEVTIRYAHELPVLVHLVWFVYVFSDKQILEV